MFHYCHFCQNLIKFTLLQVLAVSTWCDACCVCNCEQSLLHPRAPGVASAAAATQTLCPQSLLEDRGHLLQVTVMLWSARVLPQRVVYI